MLVDSASVSHMLCTCIRRPSNIIRKTRTAAPSNLDRTDDAEISLGDDDKPFEFEQLKAPVTFVEASGKDGSNLEKVTNWISQLR